MVTQLRLIDLEQVLINFIRQSCVERLLVWLIKQKENDEHKS